jgi:ATP-binding cassette subfamily B protein
VDDTVSAAPEAPRSPGEHRSAQVTVRFPAGSAAERHAAEVAGRLATVHGALLAALGLGAAPASPVRVVLTDPAADETAAGAIVQAGQIHAVYRSDAPGKGLERALVELVLTETTGLDPGRGRALVDGLLGHVTQQVDRLDPSAVRETVAAWRRAGAQPALRALLADPGAGPVYRAVATSLVGYLLEAEGPERFRAFARGFDAAAPDAATEATYGRPLAVLEQAWLGALRRGAPPVLPGIAAFLRRSAIYLRPYWRQELLLLLTVLFTAGFTVLQPLAFQLIIDRGITPRDYGFLALLMAGLAALFLVQALASLGGEYLNARVAAGVLGDIRLQLFGHLQRLSMGFYTQAQTGDLMSRLSSDLFVIQAAMTSVLVQGLFLVVTVVASTVFLLVLEWRLALLALAVAPLVFLGPKLFGARAAAAAYQQQQDSAAVATVLQENLAAQAVVKAFGLEARALGTFRDRVAILARSTVRASFIGTLLGMTGELTVTFIQLMTLGVGAYMVMGGHLSLGALVAFTGLLGNVLGPIRGAADLVQGLQQATGGMRRVDELLGEEPQIVDAAGAAALPRLAREIRLADVTFSYTGEQTTLAGVSLTIGAGQTVAIVGPSGCGKSSVLNLLLRFYDPVAGQVTIDGHDLRRVTQGSLRAQIATVLQDTFLFNASVRENIRLGRPDASDADVEAAARAAEIDELIRSLPQGYDTTVGERGARLSGGQRQRLAISRAILRDAPLLLLDEATSALDPQTEAAITRSLGTLARGRTTIMVTHRLASVVHADRIFVMERGRLVQQGTHDALLAQPGLYRRLWEQQHGAVPAAVEPLQTVPLFQSLDGALLAAVASRLVTARYEPGAVIVEEGQPGATFHVVTRGEVEVVTTGPTGAETRLGVLRAGDYFGEMALLREAPRSATVRARRATELLALDRAQFATLLETFPDLRAALDRAVEARTLANRALLAA